MGDLRETAASLRFFDDNLNPDEITELLGSQPTIGYRKGDFWINAFGITQIAHTGSWRLKVARRQPGDLDAQIAELFKNLTDDQQVWRDLALRFRADLFCGLFLQDTNEGLGLKPETLVGVGSRGLLLDLDVYWRGKSD